MCICFLKNQFNFYLHNINLTSFRNIHCGCLMIVSIMISDDQIYKQKIKICLPYFNISRNSIVTMLVVFLVLPHTRSLKL